MSVTDETYCATHDVFNCWFGHPAPFGWGVIEADDPEDLDAPTVTPQELDAAQAAQNTRFSALSAARGRGYTNPYVSADESGALIEITGQANDFDGRTFYGRTGHGARVLVKVTSRTWQPRPRVRVTSARDHGYSDGRITFDGDSFGGFGWVEALQAVGFDR